MPINSGSNKIKLISGYELSLFSTIMLVITYLVPNVQQQLHLLVFSVEQEMNH